MNQEEIRYEIQERLRKLDDKLRIAESCKSFYAIGHLQDERDFLVELLLLTDSTF